MYWSGTSLDEEKLVSQYETCEKFKRVKEALKPHSFHIDLLNGRS